MSASTKAHRATRWIILLATSTMGSIGIVSVPQAFASVNENLNTVEAAVKSIEATEWLPEHYIALEAVARQEGRNDFADYFAQRAAGGQDRGWLGVGRKAAVWALRHHADKIPQKLRPYAGKIADFLDASEAWEVQAIATGLLSLGVPPDVAWETARWVVLAFG